MQLKIAERHDIEGVISLQQKYHIALISEDEKSQGFVTTEFSHQQLTDLIEREQGLFVALEDGKVVAYLMAASWTFWAQWPVQAFMLSRLDQYSLNDTPITIHNSYQYGPICIDGALRGTGLLQQLFSFALDSMSARYEILVTFVNKSNLRSMAAHIEKLKLQELGEFEFNTHRYAWLACPTTAAHH
ncbi:MAG: GNAT family acetyltransferase [Burkholderiaceae bacterium]|nr:MAG: GNAT family acetyltransferase [Burkholderiaceae bacterium]